MSARIMKVKWAARAHKIPVDSLLNDLGIDGGNLSKMGGLVREARDIQTIARGAEKAAGSDGDGGTAGNEAKDGDDNTDNPDGDAPSGSKS